MQNLSANGFANFIAKPNAKTAANHPAKNWRHAKRISTPQCWDPSSRSPKNKHANVDNWFSVHTCHGITVQAKILHLHLTLNELPYRIASWKEAYALCSHLHDIGTSSLFDCDLDGSFFSRIAYLDFGSFHDWLFVWRHRDIAYVNPCTCIRPSRNSPSHDMWRVCVGHHAPPSCVGIVVKMEARKMCADVSSLFPIGMDNLDCGIYYWSAEMKVIAKRWPFSIKKSQRCDPIKPAPPLINIFKIRLLCFKFKRWRCN